MSQAVSFIRGCGSLKEIRLVLTVGFCGAAVSSFSAFVLLLLVRSLFLMGDAPSVGDRMFGSEIWLCCQAWANCVRCFFFAGEVLIGGLLREHDVLARFVLMCDFESVYEKRQL